MAQYTPKFREQMRSREADFRSRMQTQYAAAKPASSNSHLWGLLFLAWMLSDNAEKSHADTQAMRAELTSLRQSMTAEELQYAETISVQEGWELPADAPAVADTQGASGSFEQPVADNVEPAAQRPLSALVTPINEMVGTDDPFEALFKLAWWMAPLMFLTILLSVVRAVMRG